MELKGERGEKYYYNEKTGETSWNLPTGAVPDPDQIHSNWRRVVRESDVYYFNIVTKSTVWDPPPCLFNVPLDVSPPEGWDRVWEEEGEQKPYYWNSETGETSWSYPVGDL